MLSLRLIINIEISHFIKNEIEDIYSFEYFSLEIRDQLCEEIENYYLK